MNRRDLCLAAAMLCGSIVGCDREPPIAAQPPPDPPPLVSELVESAHQALGLTIGAPLPSARQSTRMEREAYLQSAQTALKALLDLPDAKPSSPPSTPLDRDTFEQASVLLSIEVADAIDRNQPERLSRAIRAAYAYTDYWSTAGVASWVFAAAMPERLAAGVRSVAAQVDTNLVEFAMKTLDTLTTNPPDPKIAIEGTRRRILEWRQNLKGQMRVDSLLKAYATSADGRPSLSQDLVAEVRSFAKRSGSAEYISQYMLLQEADVAISALMNFLDRAAEREDARIEKPAPEQHPVALLFVLFFKPDIEMAPKLVALRQEGIQILALTMRIIAAGMPADLSSFEHLAISPVSKLPFGYKVEGDTFVLERPRRANPP